MSVLVSRFCALKLIFKLISGKECIADCAPSFELVRRRKYSERAIVTARVVVKIASQLFLWLAVKKPRPIYIDNRSSPLQTNID